MLFCVLIYKGGIEGTLSNMVDERIVLSIRQKKKWFGIFFLIPRWRDGGMEAHQCLCMMECVVLPIPCFAVTLSRPPNAFLV